MISSLILTIFNIAFRGTPWEIIGFELEGPFSFFRGLGL